jgi:NADPH:quinone reductase
MRAVRIETTGGPEVLAVAEVADPDPGPGQLVVDVELVGVNFIDTYHRSGAYPLELPTGLGLEFSGVVSALGEGVTHRHVGQRVAVAWASEPGAYAERVAVDAERTVVVPDGVALDTATALMLQGITAHFLTTSTYALGRDDTALVYAAAGGVGRTLVQLATRRGARVLACTSTDEKAADVTALGADEVVRYRDVSVPDTVRELTGGQGVDVVYDSVGAATFDDSLASLKPRGTMVLYGASSGPVPPMDPQTLAKHGSLFLTRPKLPDYIATPDELEWRAGALLDLAASGQLDVAIHERYPLEDAARAHADLASGTTSGKLLLQP